MKVGIIPMTKARNKKGNLSQIEDEDLILSIEDQSNRIGESKYLY